MERVGEWRQVGGGGGPVQQPDCLGVGWLQKFSFSKFGEIFSKIFILVFSKIFHEFCEISQNSKFSGFAKF